MLVEKSMDNSTHTHRSYWLRLVDILARLCNTTSASLTVKQCFYWYKSQYLYSICQLTVTLTWYTSIH